MTQDRAGDEGGLADDAPVTVPRRRGKALAGQLIGLAISVACIAFVATRIDVAALGTALLHFDLRWVALGLVSLAFGYTGRIARWAMMLRAAGATTTTRAAAAPFLGSIALNNVLPFRAGDVVRALVFPARLGVERTTATASLLLERVMDLAALVLCLGIGIGLLGGSVEVPAGLRRVLVIASIGTAFALAFLLFASPWIGRMLRGFASIELVRSKPLLTKVNALAATVFERMAAMSRPRVLLKLTMMSIPVWIGEAGLYLSLLQGVGVPVGPPGALLAMSATTLATLVPSTPGYVGPFHLAAFAAASMLGVAATEAGAFAVVVHFTLWAATTLAGAIAILTHRDLFLNRTRATVVTTGAEPDRAGGRQAPVIAEQQGRTS